MAVFDDHQVNASEACDLKPTHRAAYRPTVATAQSSNSSVHMHRAGNGSPSSGCYGFRSNLKGWFEHHAGAEWVHALKKNCDLGVKQFVQGNALLLPLEASLSSLGFATFPLIDPSLDV